MHALRRQRLACFTLLTLSGIVAYAALDLIASVSRSVTGWLGPCINTCSEEKTSVEQFAVKLHRAGMSELERYGNSPMLWNTSSDLGSSWESRGETAL
jgi:hypothetical protein